MILVLALEPPPTGWTAAGESLVKHAETRPDVIFPLICIVLAAGIPILFGFAVLRYWLPRWEAQAQLDRVEGKASDSEPGTHCNLAGCAREGCRG